MSASRSLLRGSVAGVGLAVLLCAQVSLPHHRKAAPSLPAKTAPPAVAPVKGPAPTDALPVVGHLATRDRLITIEISPQGPRYTVRHKDGRVLHQSLSEKELQTRAPELHRLVKQGVATGANKGGAPTDARLKPRLDGRLDGRR